MDRNSGSRTVMPGAPYGLVDSQGQMQSNPQGHPHVGFQQQPHAPSQYLGSGSVVHPLFQDVFPMSCGQAHKCGQQVLEKGDCAKGEASEDDEPCLNAEDGFDNSNEMGKGKNSSQWHRVKWTDNMVKLLITTVSYIGDDSASECSKGGRRKFSVLQKKGKWKSVSKVMAERGCYVSPQQCEDKFNDLNKRYKRLNDILGRGTSCQVVEKPALLDMMDHISDKAKEDVRKILSSKHLFYEEMCSFHNGNRLHLPADPALKRSLQLALQSKDDHDTRRALPDNIDEDHDDDSDDMEDVSEENHMLLGGGGISCLNKRLKQMEGNSCSRFGSVDCNTIPPIQGICVDMNLAFPDCSEPNMEKQFGVHKAQLEERTLQIQAQMLELETQRLKWKHFSKKKDRELDKFRMENEKMKLENEQLAQELKQKELNVGLNH